MLYLDTIIFAVCFYSCLIFLGISHFYLDVLNTGVSYLRFRRSFRAFYGKGVKCSYRLYRDVFLPICSRELRPLYDDCFFIFVNNRKD